MPHATSEDDVYNGFFIPKGGYFRYTDIFRRLLIRIYRCGGDGERMVRNLPYPRSVGINFC